MSPTGVDDTADAAAAAATAVARDSEPFLRRHDSDIHGVGVDRSRRRCHDEQDSAGSLPPSVFNKRAKLASDGDGSKLANTTTTAAAAATSKSTTTKSCKPLLPSFLSSHLRILKALYQNDHNNSNDDEDVAEMKFNGDNEDVVSKDVWTMTESFLNQRLDMNEKQVHAKRTDGIYQEYVNFWDNEDVGIGPGDSSGPTLTALQRPPPPPPQLHHHLASPGSKGGSGAMFHAHGVDTSMPPSTYLRSIHLVSRLLQHKSNLQERLAQECATPFLPLVQEVQHRIATLQTMMRNQETQRVQRERAVALQLLTNADEGSTRFENKHGHDDEDEENESDDDVDDWGHQYARKSNSTSPSVLVSSPIKMEAAKERVSAMEIKLRLWQQLAKDLSALVKT